MNGFFCCDKCGRRFSKDRPLGGGDIKSGSLICVKCFADYSAVNARLDVPKKTGEVVSPSGPTHKNGKKSIVVPNSDLFDLKPFTKDVSDMP